jgi:hypothetical protein
MDKIPNILDIPKQTSYELVTMQLRYNEKIYREIEVKIIKFNYKKLIKYI